MVHVSATTRQRTLHTLGLYESGIDSCLSPFSTPPSSRQQSVFTPTPCCSENGDFTPSACRSDDSDFENICMPSSHRSNQLTDKLAQLNTENKRLTKAIMAIKKQKKEDKKVGKRNIAHMALVTEALKPVTAVMTPLPEGSLFRFAIMIAETFMVIRRKNME